MKKASLVILLFLLPMIVLAQNNGNQKKLAEEIKANADYIYGEGWGGDARRRRSNGTRQSVKQNRNIGTKHTVCF